MGRLCQKVTQHVTMLGRSQIVARGVPILKIAAIIAPGKCWGALLDHLARNLLSTTRTGDSLAQPVRRPGFAPVFAYYLPLGDVHMPMSEEISVIVLEGGNAIQIAEAAQRAGINDLRQSALVKAAAGTTSLAEINRVTKD